MEKKWKIKNHNNLLDLYKKYRESFSEHLILNIILKIYVMIKKMSFKIKFYEFFLKDKEKIARKLKK